MEQPTSPSIDPMKHFAKSCAIVKLLALQIVHGRVNTVGLVLRAFGTLSTLSVAVAIAKGWL